MKVLIVCANGMTSSVFALKLSELAQAKHIDLEFRAIGMYRLTMTLSDYIAVLIAPQIQQTETNIINLCEENQTPYYYISHENFDFSNIEKSFDAIYVQLLPLLTSTYESKKPKLTSNDYKELGIKILSSTIFMYVTNILLELLYLLTHWKLFNLFSTTLNNCFCLYIVLQTGYQIGKTVQENPLTFALIALGSSLLFSPFNQGFRYNVIGQLTITNTFLELRYFTPKYVFVYIFLLITIMPIFTYLYKCTKVIIDKYNHNNIRDDLFLAIIPGFIIFVLILVLRLICSPYIF